MHGAAMQYAVETRVAAKSTTDVGLVEGATNTINEAAGRLNSLYMQVRSIADATFGGRDLGNAAGAPEAPSSGRAENLQRAGSSLHQVITALEAEVNRLNSL